MKLACSINLPITQAHADVAHLEVGILRSDDEAPGSRFALLLLLLSCNVQPWGTPPLPPKVTVSGSGSWKKVVLLARRRITCHVVSLDTSYQVCNLSPNDVFVSNWTVWSRNVLQWKKNIILLNV